MIIKKINSKSILSKSKVADYTINPYVGCEHGCTYCYARFMKRFTGHSEPWSTFVDVKVNAVDLLKREIKRKKPGRVWVSGVCDPYQPIEKEYQITRKCLEIFSSENWPITLQTKSPLVLRDLDLLKKMDDVEVGLTVTTADENARKIFEPNAPSIRERIDALESLHSSDLKTYAMIAPLLPGAEKLTSLLFNKIDYVLIDRMNYNYADWVYRKFRLEFAMTEKFFGEKKRRLASEFRRNSIPCQLLF